jgi:predicted N-acyltransferase
MYIILSHNGEPMARATFWLTSRELMPTQSRVVRYALEAVLRRWPLLICQAPLTSMAATTGLVLPEPPLRDAALTTIAEAALDLARQHGASFSLFAYLQKPQSQLPAWPAEYTPTILYGSGTRLNIEWSDFEGYLAHLNKKRRYNIRRNMRLGKELGIEITFHPTVMDVGKAISLHRNVNQQHRAPTEPWMKSAFEHTDMVDSVWLAAMVDGQLVGCELMLGDQRTWLVTGLGLDYSVDYAYFLLGYADIQRAIEMGARVLRWGSLAYKVKRRLGFELESNDWVVFAGSGALLQKLGRWLSAMEESRAYDLDEH